MTCLVSEGDIPLDISWSFESSVPFTEIGITTHKFGYQGSVLLIAETNASHQGHYTCSVKNNAGTADYTTSLDVHGKIIDDYVHAIAKACTPANPKEKFRIVAFRFILFLRCSSDDL